MDELVLWIVFVLAALLCGGIAGWFSCTQIRRDRLRDIQTRASKITETAQQDAEAMKKTALLEARDEWRREYKPLEKELENRKHSQRKLENELREREQQLDSKFDILDGKERDLLKTEKALGDREHAIEESERDVQELVHQQRKQLESLAGMTQPEARQMLIEQLEQSARQLAARKVRARRHLPRGARPASVERRRPGGDPPGAV